MAFLQSRNLKNVLIALLIAASLGGNYLYAAPEGMSAPFMMTSRATGTNGPKFDATKWFENGMYAPQEFDSKLNPYIMTRNEPFVFKAKDNQFLVQVAIEALDDVQPQVNTRIVWNAWPVLTKRVRYSHSFFMAPDKPADVYKLYLQVSYRRFVIDLQLEGDDGNITYTGETQEVTSTDPEEEEHNNTFDEMDDAGTR